VCALKGMLDEALQAFLTTLNRYTLADVLKASGQRKLSGIFADFAVWSG
jgi:DNA-binding IscR family transcriptional regulator